MIVSNLKALEGLLWGVALGDSLNRAPRFRKAPFLLHSATGTWFLSVYQAVFSDSDLALKLEILAAPHYALALRGSQPSLAQTLHEVATHYPSQKLLGDILPCMMPLAFYNKEDELVKKLIEWTQVTHRHPRVISSIALLVGALRALLLDPKLSLEGQLEQGERLADKTLHLLFERREADTPQAIWSAHQALRHHVALAKGSVDPRDLQVPLGFDGRDCPEQLVVYVLGLASAENALERDFDFILEQGGTSDILAPLLLALIGFKQGAGVFPEQWSKILWGKELWSRHLVALAQRDSYFPCLVEEEIKLSRQEQVALKELDHFQTVANTRNQLALFEDQVIKRELVR
ncbi:MAG: ADP-ribosylglycohydrolase family protein [Myxococcaceae bacterium]